MRERIIQKTGRIKEDLQIIDDLKPDCEKRFSTDPVYRRAILHYLYLLADTCIALAEIIIRHKNLRPPQSHTTKLLISLEKQRYWNLNLLIRLQRLPDSETS